MDPRNVTTINGVVIDHQTGAATAAGGKKVRRDHSFKRPNPVVNPVGQPVMQVDYVYNGNIINNNNNNGMIKTGHPGQLKAARSVTSMNQNPETGSYQHVPVGGRNGYMSRGHNFDTRASYNERQIRAGQSHFRPLQAHHGSKQQLTQNPNDSQFRRDNLVYKSNGSLDLDSEVEMVQEVITNVNQSGYNRRDFGSHGSIDMIPTRNPGYGHQRGFPDVNAFETASVDGVTVNGGPAAVSTLQRKTTTATDRSEESGAGSVMSSGSLDDSPKQKKKGRFNRKSNDSTAPKSPIQRVFPRPTKRLTC